MPLLFTASALLVAAAIACPFLMRLLAPSMARRT